MSFTRTFVPAITLAAMLTVPVAAIAQAPSATQPSSPAPRLTLVEPLKDFGTVPKGSQIDWAFSIRNTGSADLEILSVQPTCGCTVAEFDKVIKPGQTGKIVAHVDTTQFSGPIQKAVNIRTNDPDTPNAQLTINALVKPYVEAHPAGFVRFSLLQGETQTQSVKLYSEEEAPFQIVGVDSPAEWILVDTVQVADADRVPSGRPGQAQYAINITIDEDAAIGPLAQKVIVRTNSKHQPEYTISVAGVVRPAFAVNPSIVNFGDAAPGSPESSRTILLASNDRNNPATFQVTKVESASNAVTASVRPSDTPGQYEVTVSLAPGAKGAIDSNVKIHTNSKANPVVTVPVKSSVASAAAATR